MTRKAYRQNYAGIDWSMPIDIERKPQIPPARSSLPCPTIRSDYMPPTQSMADGKIYESKSAMEAATKRAGCITVGNEKFKPREKARATRREIKETVEKAAARVARGERARK